jgi:hypothetical protein
MTLHIKEDETVAAVPLPQPLRKVPDGVVLALEDQRRGLLLRSVSSHMPKHVQERVRARLKDGLRAA